jgi:hypothetical protein
MPRPKFGAELMQMHRRGNGRALALGASRMHLSASSGRAASRAPCGFPSGRVALERPARNRIRP